MAATSNATGPAGRGPGKHPAGPLGRRAPGSGTAPAIHYPLLACAAGTLLGPGNSVFISVDTLPYRFIAS